MPEKLKTEIYVDSALTALFYDLCFDGRRHRKTEDWISMVSSIINKLLPTYNFIIHQSELDLGELQFEDEILNWYFPIGRKSYRVVIFQSGIISTFKKPKKAVYFADGGPEKAEAYKYDDNKGDLHSFHFFRCSAGQRPRFKLQYKGPVFNKEEAMLRASESLEKLSQKK